MLTVLLFLSQFDFSVIYFEVAYCFVYGCCIFLKVKSCDCFLYPVLFPFILFDLEEEGFHHLEHM